MNEINSNYDSGYHETYDNYETYADESDSIDEYTDGNEGEVGLEAEVQEKAVSSKEKLQSFENSLRKNKAIDPDLRKEELKKLEELEGLLNKIGDGKNQAEQELALTFDEKLAEIENEVGTLVKYGDKIKAGEKLIAQLEKELNNDALPISAEERKDLQKTLDETREALREDPSLNVEEATGSLRETLEATRLRQEKNQAKEAKIEEIRNTLQNSIGKIGVRNKTKAINVNQVIYYSEASYSAGSKPKDSTQKADDVKKVLDLITQALGKTDETKREENWNKVTDFLSQWKTQGIDAGHVNDRAQLLFNVLYGELGEEGLKEAFQQGIIPSGFSTHLIQLLEIKPDENTSTKEATTFQQGGPGWTHLTSSEWLKKYGKNTNMDEGDE